MDMDQLFDAGEAEPARARRRRRSARAAARRACARARSDELVGQEHLLGEGSALRSAIEEGRPHSMVLYGPPGTGKTTLARIVAAAADAAFEELSAVEAGRAEVREVLERAAAAPRGRPSRRSSSSTRSTASTRPSRTRCCRRSRRGSSR